MHEKLGQPGSPWAQGRRAVSASWARMLCAGAVAASACDGTVTAVEPLPDVVGAYELVAYRAEPLPSAYEGTRITRFRTLRGALVLGADSSYERSIVQEYRLEDASNPFNPGPVFDTVTVSDRGAFRVYRDSVVFTWEEPGGGPTWTWPARIVEGTLRTYEYGGERLRFAAP